METLTQVLVLDRNYNPVDIFPFTKAIRKVMSERAEALEFYVDDEIGYTWNSAMKCPAVIRLLYFVQKSRRFSRFQKLTRQNILVRDNHQCQYCDNKLTMKTLSWDHVVPRDKGGLTTWTNLVACCVKCNVKKGNKLLHECGMHLKRKPTKPTLVQGQIHNTMLGNLKKLPSESWKNYIYFNVELVE